MSHSFFSPSKASMWMACHGALAMPENQREDSKPSKYADSGTASHAWAATALQTERDAVAFLGEVQTINGAVYAMDADRAEAVQYYLDEVRRRAMGAKLWVERHVDLSDYLGEDQGGTADAIVFTPDEVTIIDLKSGSGERVYASGELPDEPNPQLALYALGVLKDLALIDYAPLLVRLVIVQPPMQHIDEFPMATSALYEFGERAKHAAAKVGEALTLPFHSKDLHQYLTPGAKQCRWCRAAPYCPALAKRALDEVRMDFEDADQAAPLPPRDTDQLAASYQMLPVIELWIKAVRAEVQRIVAEGGIVKGPDGQPYKFVEGNEGSRQWDADRIAEIEAALLGQLPPDKVYERKMLTAPAAAKLLDKKATKAIWTDVFAPMIKRPRQQPKLVPGSDPRPPVSAVATADDFEVET